MFQRSKIEIEADQKRLQENRIRDAKRRDIEARVDNGCEILSWSEFNSLTFQGKLNFHRSGGTTKG